MIAFPDTSFLCAFYRHQDNSPQAAAYFKAMPEVRMKLTGHKTDAVHRGYTHHELA